MQFLYGWSVLQSRQNWVMFQLCRKLLVLSYMYLIYNYIIDCERDCAVSCCVICMREKYMLLLSELTIKQCSLCKQLYVKYLQNTTNEFCPKLTWLHHMDLITMKHGTSVLSYVRRWIFVALHNMSSRNSCNCVLQKLIYKLLL